ncbi:MAG: glutamate-1-semialdehyde 2,1-aminomutase [Gemmatimonadetes bacterium]|nr:glutamate-1-semialdehyde 2,1-aminomutase [Gemmatimonadota bacterium]
MNTRSKTLFDAAQQVIPGGVNSPARAFGPVGGDPLFIVKGEGARIVDVDGRSYIDFVGSWGPLILGHAHPEIVAAVNAAAAGGTSFGAPTEIEVKMAQLVTEMVPSVEMVRMVNSGTEATMSAIRLARGHTGRNKIVKFEGCWHGHADSFLIQAGSSALTMGAPSSPGVTPGTAADSITVPFNDLEAVEKAVVENRDEIAAVIVEPVAGNMGVIPPAPGFLQGLRDITAERGIVLIFDEVITGFRVSQGGAQELYGVTPDLTTLGKIIGGGLPVGAFGGRREIMSDISPLGKMVSQAGTLSGNPLAMTAGYEMLKRLQEPGVYEVLEAKSQALETGILENLKSLGLKYQTNRVGSIMTLFFTELPVTSFDAANACDQNLFARYFREMLNRGVYLAPSQFEAAFVSLAHSDADIDKTIKANYEALKACIS